MHHIVSEINAMLCYVMLATDASRKTTADTHASSLTADRLQTGNSGIQDTVYFSTEMSSSTHFQSAHRLNNVTMFIYTSSPSGCAH